MQVNLPIAQAIALTIDGSKLLILESCRETSESELAQIFPLGVPKDVLCAAIANVSSILLVFAFDQPPIEPRNMSRFLISAEAADLPFNIALNKADLVRMRVIVSRTRHLHKSALFH